MSFRISRSLRILLCTFVLLPISSWAGTVVRVNTPLGEFYLDMLDETTPGTVSNFVSYVESGQYNGTVIHRLVPGFVIQGGWLSYDEPSRIFSPITSRGNIQNEFRVSNQRGTIAMAKVGGDPNSANSQWFINLGDNSALDTSNGGFTVFGRVMGNGMQVVDAIAALPPLYVLQGMDPFPLINYTGGSLLSRHLVEVNMSIAGRTDGLPAVFDPATGRVRIYVDAGELGLLSVELVIVSEIPTIVIKLDPASLFPLERHVSNMAVFNNANGRLTMPEIHINGEVAWRNVRFQLTDASELIFTLEGLDQ